MERASLTKFTNDTCTINHLEKQQNISGTTIVQTKGFFNLHMTS